MFHHTQKYTTLFILLLYIAFFISIWLFPSATPALGTVSLLSSLAMAIHAIFEKHKKTEKPRPKIAKDILVLILTILLIAFLGGIAVMLANTYVSLSFGAVVGLVSALGVSFTIGYAIKKGMGRLI